jgi:tetratricopeptide (TPR) repeat protein
LDNGDPNRAATDLLALGDKLAHSGNQDRANKLYILVTKMSNEPQGYLEVGRRFNQQGQFEEAARLLGKGDEESEGNEGYKTTRAFINKEWGVALFNLHRCNDAEIKLHRAADLFKELNESDPTVTNLLKGAGHGC